MHGTFLIPRREQTFFATDVSSLCVCLAFIALPLVLATVVAMVEFGSDLGVANMLDVLRLASNAAAL